MMERDDFLAADAIARFLDGKSLDFVNSMQPIQGGLSGGAVYRCHTPVGVFALKRWPDQTSRQRIAEVHRVQEFVSQELPIVPRLKRVGWKSEIDKSASQTTHFENPCMDIEGTCLELSGKRFELSSWMPGKSFDRTKQVAGVDHERLQAVGLGAGAIAEFHRRSEKLGQNDEIAPSVSRRCERLCQLQSLLPHALTRPGIFAGSIGEAIKLLAAHWRKFHHLSESRLRPWLHRPVPVVWVLRDVHCAHILFDGGQVSGMVDFDAVNRDTRATDLARWVGSFADFDGPNEPLWKAAIEGYTQQHPFSPCEQELAGAIEEASWYIHLANWVIWTTQDSQEIPGGLDAAERRVERLLRRNFAQTFSGTS